MSITCYFLFLKVLYDVTICVTTLFWYKDKNKIKYRNNVDCYSVVATYFLQ